MANAPDSETCEERIESEKNNENLLLTVGPAFLRFVVRASKDWASRTWRKL